MIRWIPFVRTLWDCIPFLFQKKSFYSCLHNSFTSNKKTDIIALIIIETFFMVNYEKLDSDRNDFIKF